MSNHPVLTREQCRAVDRYAIEVLGVPGAVLMENAGRNAAEFIVRMTAASSATGGRKRAVILCGKGNNGGDGFVIARHLLRHGWSIQVCLAAHPSDLAGDAAINFAPLHRLGVKCTPLTEPTLIEQAAAEWSQCDVLVDALLGTGFEGQVREPLASLIERINAMRGPRCVAVDIPSGLDANTGTVGGIAVRATHTVTFLAPKPGLLAPLAAAYVGELSVADIGIPLDLVLARI